MEVRGAEASEVMELLIATLDSAGFQEFTGVAPPGFLEWDAQEMLDKIAGKEPRQRPEP